MEISKEKRRWISIIPVCEAQTRENELNGKRSGCEGLFISARNLLITHLEFVVR
jgi:hypothetical protein